MKKIKSKKIKDEIIFANTISLAFISFIIILGMTIFLVHKAVEAETEEMDKLVLPTIKKLNNVTTDKLKETYKNYDYADKQYISLAVEKNGNFIYLTDDENRSDFKKIEANKLETKWDRFVYKRIYTVCYAFNVCFNYNFDYRNFQNCSRKCIKPFNKYNFSKYRNEESQYRRSIDKDKR